MLNIKDLSVFNILQVPKFSINSGNFTGQSWRSPLIRFCFILTLLLMFAAGCKTTEEYHSQLTMQDSGRTLSLKQGDTFRIALQSNPTTGFSWIEAGKPDPDVIRLTAKRFASARKQKNLVGASGETEFVYKAVGPGETEIRLNYKRSWETVAPAKTFMLKILVPGRSRL